MDSKKGVCRMIHTVEKGVLGGNRCHLLGCTSSARNWAGRRKYQSSQNETPSGL